MSTLSIPINPDMAKAIEALIRQGVAGNKADLVRRAIDKYIEDQAVESVLKAMKEPTLSGNLDDLVKKIG